MAHTVENSFTAYALNEDERVEASKLSTLQRKVIQTAVAEIAEAMIHMKLDPNDIESFIQDQAYKQGGLDMLQYLLSASESAYANTNN